MVISLSDHEIDLILPLKHRDSCFISVLFLSNKNCLLSFGRKYMCHSLNLATDVSQLENKVNVKQNRITECLVLKWNSGDDLFQPPGSKQVTWRKLLGTMPSQFLDIFKDGDPITSVGTPFLFVTPLTVKNFLHFNGNCCILVCAHYLLCCHSAPLTLWLCLIYCTPLPT